MAITTVLFDLDGTLLPMDQEVFVGAYFKEMTQKAASWGYEPKKLMDALLRGIQAAIGNSGDDSNETLFWKVLTETFGEDARKDEALFDDFYRNEFQRVQQSCGFQPLAQELIARLKEQGRQLILATNPLFPRIATYSRIRWAGLDPEDFTLVTTYENSRRCKPSLDYYRNILEELRLNPAECIMVGNDVEEDMIAAQLGMGVFLLTDCLISRNGQDLSIYPHGGFQSLMDHLEAAL